MVFAMEEVNGAYWLYPMPCFSLQVVIVFHMLEHDIAFRAQQIIPVILMEGAVYAWSYVTASTSWDHWMCFLIPLASK